MLKAKSWIRPRADDGTGVPEVWLGLNPRNEGAKKFYERIGFKVINGSVDANEMWLRLEKSIESCSG